MDNLLRFHKNGLVEMSILVNKMDYSYKIYYPGGNKTALVLGLVEENTIRKEINDDILTRHPDVEQVGFISTTGSPQLLMAGGEFCGNASRCAAYEYLHGEEGVLSLKVYDGSWTIRVGIENNRTWAEIPRFSKLVDNVTLLAQGVYKVRLPGITHLVCVGLKKAPQQEAQKIMDCYQEQAECLGVIFTDFIRIQPIVSVKSLQTLYYETACGSGSVAVALVKAHQSSVFKNLPLLQPSGEQLIVELDGERPVISGRLSELSYFSAKIDL